MLNDLLFLSGFKKRWPILSEEEIRMHNTRRSLWIVSGNSVYDVTGVLGSHPGGEAAILRRGGGSKNCEADYTFHSRYARREWDNCKVGEITPEVALRLFPPRTGTHEENTRSVAACTAGSPPVGISRAHMNSGEESHTRTVDTYASTTATPDQQYRRTDFSPCPQRVRMPVQAFWGTVFETPDRHTLNIIRNALVVVHNGTIEQVIDPATDAATYASVLEAASAAGHLTRLQKGQYLIPGLIDLHVHAPQWPQLGMALDKRLDTWLQQYSFPLEARYKDLVFAEKSYSSLVSALLANGTTTVAYFASIHLEASLLLARICLEKGQRAVVGRVAMDLADQCPEYYRDASPEESVAQSEDFVQQVRGLKGNTEGLVLPSLIPRFIPSCSDAALRGLGELAKNYGCHVQTHCSESDWEHNHVIERYGKHDALALDDFGLLTRRTVLAHCNYLSTEDMQLVKARGAAVGHCPLSNFYFSGAVFPLKKALDMGVHVGMGTDISGGPSASLFDACRYALAAGRALESGTDPCLSATERSQHSGARVSSVEAFFVATANGGISLDLKVGRIAPGYMFDALVIDTTLPNSSLIIFEGIDTLEDVFQKIVYNAAPHNILQTYVNGRLVSQH